MSNNIFLIENHDEALKVWRQKKIKDLDLIHLDAHVDFGFYMANPIEQVFKQAGSLRELKMNLEKSLAFRRYERDFNKQTNIGNYIYPGICEGIVKDYYWVIPGGRKEFKKSLKFIKGILNNFNKSVEQTKQIKLQIKDGLLKTKLFDRDFVICILEKLPVLRQKVLLDIDVDFLTIDSLLNAASTVNIGKRIPWIYPDALVKILKKRIKNPEVITIAYSVNGGFTPMKYKCLGDEIAYRISPRHFEERFRRSSKAAKYFELFNLIGKRQDYKRAIDLDRSYRANDNNYGSLYLRSGKLSKAEKEFKRIAIVDPKNPYPFTGLGEVCLQRKDFHKARQYFSYGLRHKKGLPSALYGLAWAEFKLKNFKKSKELFCRYQALRPLESQSYYFLGCIYEKEKRFQEALAQYKGAINLRLNDINLLYRLLRISCYVKEESDIIKLVSIRYKEFKKEFDRVKELSLKKGRKLKGLRKIERKMLSFEGRLKMIKID